MPLTFRRIQGVRQSSSGRTVLVAEFDFPEGDMTGLGKFADTVTEQLNAFAAVLSTAQAKPAVSGDAEDVVALNRLSDASDKVAALQKAAAAAASGAAAASPPTVAAVPTA